MEGSLIMSDEEYAVIDTPQWALERAIEVLAGVEKMQSLPGFSPTDFNYISLIKSFVSVIDALDPYGNNYRENSLAGRWDHARWFNGNPPTTEEENSIVMAQYCSVIKSVLSGKLKVCAKSASLLSSKCIFHKRDLPVEGNFIFVLMPFIESWSSYIWKSQIKPIVESIKDLKLVCMRADDLYGSDVVQDIYESILRARVIIADITNRNANVFYELGIAHALGKEVILLTQGTEHIPFDLTRFRHCVYSNDGPGYEHLAQSLPNMIRAIILK